MQDMLITTTYKELLSPDELPVNLAELLINARLAIIAAYAPYSNYKVGAAVLLENGKIVMGSNQENASLPVGLCAERVALSAASSGYPLIPVTAIAISAKGKGAIVSEPVAPCGICRQTLLEYEHRFQRDIEIILQGEEGRIYRIPSAKALLPLYFGTSNLGK